MTQTGLLWRLVVFVFASWAAWRTALRVAPAWLRRGEGPLWLVASVVPLAIATVAICTGPQSKWLKTLRFLADADDPFHWLLVAMLAALATYALARFVYAQSRNHKAWSAFFLSAGALPNGSYALDVQGPASRGLFWLLVSALALAVVTQGQLSAAVRLDPNGAPLYPVLWGCGFASLACSWLSFIHPSTPWQPLPSVADSDPEGGIVETDLHRAKALLTWLGAQPWPHSPETAAVAAADDLQPYQAAVLAQAAATSVVAISGPVGSGRTTLAFLLAAEHINGTGGTALMVVRSRRRSDDAASVIGRARARWAAAGVLTVQTGADPTTADVWVVQSEDLLNYLNMRTRGRAQRMDDFLSRLAFVCFDDIEDFSASLQPERRLGSAMLEQRYLLCRLEAIQGIERTLKRVVVGSLPDAAMKQAASHITATDSTGMGLFSLWRDAGQFRKVERHSFHMEDVNWNHFHFVPGTPAMLQGMAKIAQSGSPRERFQVRVTLPGQPPMMVPSLDVEDSNPIQVIRIDGVTASELLGRGRRYLATGGSSAVEVLTFSDDLVARWLEARLLYSPHSWPQELPLHAYPRVLASLPGHGLRSRGARVRARHHLRAAMLDGPLSVQRLRHVFSPGVVDEFMAQHKDQLTVEHLWQLPDIQQDGQDSSNSIEAVTLTNSALQEAQGEEVAAELHAPSEGRTWMVSAALLNYEFPVGSIVDFGGNRFQVQLDHRRGGDFRILMPVDDARQASPVRTLQFAVEEVRETQTISFRSHRVVRWQRARVRVEVEQTGYHVFAYETGNGKWSLVRSDTQRLDTPLRDQRLVTQALILWLDDASPTVLHTLAHLFRHGMDFLFVRASQVIGVAHQLSLGGKPAIVLYETSDGGNGCLETIQPDNDVRALFNLSRAILRDCPRLHEHMASPATRDKPHACGACCKSGSCTHATHNSELDAIATLRWLDTAYEPSGPAAP